ncbi:hypothetical protein CRYUN_Cryun22dG0065500 [Craigia yunnanensis]
MEDRKEKNAPWLSVPQFGHWDQKGLVTDYSLDFSKIREMRKQNKREVSRASLGNEEEFINPTATSVSTAPSDDHHHYPQNHHSPTVRFPSTNFPNALFVDFFLKKIMYSKYSFSISGS